MKTVEPVREGRLFTSFIDSVDGTMCLSAHATAAQIDDIITGQHLRFPLNLDAAATLEEQARAATHAPASSRFGPYCDNILGMNWRLPSGRVARIGERVVKTTTGYDWLRFLLHSGRRYGEPLDYVIRLRPDCGFNIAAHFEGSIPVLHSCVRRLLHSGWMHWWDSVDFIYECGAASLRVGVHCPRGEAGMFEAELCGIARAFGARLRLEEVVQPPFDGLPDMVVKTTPERAINLAVKLGVQAERCIALCYNGVVHVQLARSSDISERAHALMQPHLAEIYALGGDCHSRWLPATPPTITESQWIETLEQTIHAS